MQKVAYLASRDMFPGAEHPRGDAFEYGLMMDALVPAFEARGLGLEGVAWDGSEWEAFDAALIGTPWDYCDRAEAFFERLDRIAERMPLFNDPVTARWNGDKRYLAELAAAGVPSIPTMWVEPGADLSAGFERLQSDTLVAKRVVGAGAYGQHRFGRGDTLPAVEVPMMVQPFLPEIVSFGELSIVVVDGAVSHGLRKLPAAGDYRIQSLYGGREVDYAPDAEALAVVESALAQLAVKPVYARVDLVQHDGHLALIELELIEPYLYPEQGPQLGERLAVAVRSRLDGGR